MGQRQEHQQSFPGAQQLWEARRRAARLVEQIGVGQLAALRAAGGARRVNQRGRVVGPQPRQPLVELADVH